MLREIKPRNARSARALKERAPREREGAKQALFLRSSSSSALANDMASDLCRLKKPHAVRFNKKNAGIHPFENASSLEFFSRKNDTSLLCFASHSKKRPHTLTFVRCFDGAVLDMLECGIAPDSARAAAQFAGGRSVRVGLKPLLSFSGAAFDDDHAAAAAAADASGNAARFRLAKSLFADFFRGEEVTDLDVEGLQQLISFAASEIETPGADGPPTPVVHMRVWRLVTQRSGQRLPRVELEEIGPRLDLRLRRYREADPAVLREAMKRARGSEPKSRKNIDMDSLGDKTGRIHLGRQDLSQLQTRKMKGLKRRRDDDEEGDGAVAEDGQEADANGLDGDTGDDDDDDDDGASDFGSLNSGDIEFVDDGDDDDDDGGVDLEMVTASEGEDDGKVKGAEDAVSPKRVKLAR